MNRFFNTLRLHTLALLCWCVAFFMWKDYLTHPHHRVTRGELVSFSGTFSQAGTLISLPSGYASGNYILLKEAQRSLSPGYFDDFRAFEQSTREGEPVTVLHSPEVDLRASGDAAVVFSVVTGGKEHIDTEAQIRSYNEHLDRRLRDASLTTLGGFVLFGLVWGIKRRFFDRA
ncbi:MAG: hypothetical protein U0359_31195 [Byssovorax sp.]